jgi:hypothetical protein
MTELAFTVLDVQPQAHAAAPHLLFRLRVTEHGGACVHAMALRCQLRIEPQRRPYDAHEQAGLEDLFGTPDRWGATARPFLWTHAATMLRGFEGSLEFDLPVACTYDFEVSGTKYLHALAGGEVPLALLFSGTVFTRGATGFAVEQLSWALEAETRMPVRVWRELMDLYFPHSGWIRLDLDTLDALIRYKSARALTSWEQALDQLLPVSERAS